MKIKIFRQRMLITTILISTASLTACNAQTDAVSPASKSAAETTSSKPSSGSVNQTYKLTTVAVI